MADPLLRGFRRLQTEKQGRQFPFPSSKYSSRHGNLVDGLLGLDVYPESPSRLSQFREKRK